MSRKWSYLNKTSPYTMHIERIEKKKWEKNEEFINTSIEYE